jgi:hypothetical protein
MDYRAVWWVRKRRRCPIDMKYSGVQYSGRPLLDFTFNFKKNDEG